MNYNNHTISDKIINRFRKVAKRRLEKLRTTPVRIHNRLRLSTSVSDKKHTWRYVTPTRETWIRAKTMLTKEPETIDWLDSVPIGDIFWDIGASVGCFSLYAARAREAVVVSFEPMSNTYAVLTENIHSNQLGSQISAFCVAFSEKTTVSYLHLTSRVAGTSEHSIDPDNDLAGSGRRFELRQSSLNYTVDDFISNFNLQVPNYIKIDVDGDERKILLGAYKTLREPSLKSILVEIDEKDSALAQESIQTLSDANFHIQTRTALKKGPENTFFNYVFSRSSRYTVAPTCILPPVDQ